MAFSLNVNAWPPPRDKLTVAIPFAAIASLSYACFVSIAHLKRLRRASTKGKAVRSNALGITFEESVQTSKEAPPFVLQKLDGAAILTFRCLRLAAVAALIAIEAIQIVETQSRNLDYALLTNFVSHGKDLKRYQKSDQFRYTLEF